VEVYFKPEQEAHLAQMATIARHLVKDAAFRLLAGSGGISKEAPQPTRANPLPVWRLGGAIGSLNRRDIYDSLPPKIEPLTP
jgi:hypothetical protein